LPPPESPDGAAEVQCYGPRGRIGVARWNTNPKEQRRRNGLAAANWAAGFLTKTKYRGLQESGDVWNLNNASAGVETPPRSQETRRCDLLRSSASAAYSRITTARILITRPEASVAPLRVVDFEIMVAKQFSFDPKVQEIAFKVEDGERLRLKKASLYTTRPT
jgi:hypothetical protein